MESRQPRTPGFRILLGLLPWMGLGLAAVGWEILGRSPSSWPFLVGIGAVMVASLLLALYSVRLWRLPFLAMALVVGLLWASIDGFPPSWPRLVFLEACSVAALVFLFHRQKRWHEDLPNRIRRNAEAAQNEE